MAEERKRLEKKIYAYSKMIRHYQAKITLYQALTKEISKNMRRKQRRLIQILEKENEMNGRTQRA